jgi:hypothetical protein
MLEGLGMGITDLPPKMLDNMMQFLIDNVEVLTSFLYSQETYRSAQRVLYESIRTKRPPAYDPDVPCKEAIRRILAYHSSVEALHRELEADPTLGSRTNVFQS